MVEITEEEKKLVDTLVDVTTSLYKLYQKLANLEIAGKKDSKEYKETLEYIKLATETEEKIYSKLDFEYEKIIAILKYCLSTYKNANFMDDIEPLITNKNALCVQRRIANILTYKSLIIDSINNPDEYSDPYEESLMSSLKSRYNRYKLYRLIDLDFNSLFIHYIDDLLKQSSYARFIPRFINMKYNVLFCDKYMMEQQPTLDFTPSSKLYIYTEAFANKHGINNEVYKKIKNSYNQQKLVIQIENLLSTKDYEFNERITAESLIRAAVIKAIYLCRSEDVVTSFYASLLHNIRNNEDFFSDTYAAQNLLETCYYDTTKDRKELIYHN